MALLITFILRPFSGYAKYSIPRLFLYSKYRRVVTGELALVGSPFTVISYESSSF